MNMAIFGKLSKAGVGTVSEAMLLEQLRAGDHTVTALARACALPISTGSRLVWRLVALKLVSLTHGKADRRERVVGLTASGRALINGGAP